MCLCGGNVSASSLYRREHEMEVNGVSSALGRLTSEGVLSIPNNKSRNVSLPSYTFLDRFAPVSIKYLPTVLSTSETEQFGCVSSTNSASRGGGGRRWEGARAAIHPLVACASAGRPRQLLCSGSGTRALSGRWPSPLAQPCPA